MRVRLAPDASCVGVRSLGALVAGCGLAAMLLWHLYFLGVLSVAAGLAASRSRSLYVLYPQRAVLAQVEKTLGLLALPFDRDGGRIVVRATRTTVRAHPIGPVTYLSFALADSRSQPEHYLMNTLVKFLKYRRYRTAETVAQGR